MGIQDRSDNPERFPLRSFSGLDVLFFAARGFGLPFNLHLPDLKHEASGVLFCRHQRRADARSERERQHPNTPIPSSGRRVMRRLSSSLFKNEH